MCVYKAVRFPGTGVTDRCELPRGFWKWNPGPPEEQPVPLHAKPSLQPLPGSFKNNPPPGRESSVYLLASDIYFPVLLYFR